MVKDHQSCFHCGEIIPLGFNVQVKINNQLQPMCCYGCEAVANTIVDNELTDYYRFRTETANKSELLVPEALKRHQLLDDESLQDEFTHQTAHYKETILSIDGISCAACAWLIEQQFAKVKGIIKVNVNATTQRASIRWHDDQLKLSEILNLIDHLGYQAMPFIANDVEKKNQRQNKEFILRLGIAGILMMQILMIAVGLYYGAFSGISSNNLIYLRLVSFLLCIPIVTYSARPFYVGAFYALKIKHLSMDVPIALAIILAFIASSWATFTSQGDVYFESVAMFTFLLLIGKYLEFRTRSHAALISANLLKLMPMTATQLIDNNETLVAAKKLCPHNIVLIKPGETVPADGIILEGVSQINEAMLTGEQKPVTKNIDDNVFSGTINTDGSLIVEVKHANTYTFLSQLIRLSERSQAHKPKIAQFSDKIAQYFVAIVLLTAIATAIYWYFHSPEQAFWIAISVLVATCPCALSLATPTALTCTNTCLSRNGIMIKSAHVIETLPKVNCFAFDKTGTLTNGSYSLTELNLFDQNGHYTKDSVLAIAASLEVHSEHPIAKVFTKFRDITIQAEQIHIKAGKGIEGIIDGVHCKIGKVSWLLNDSLLHSNTNLACAQCVLTINDKLIAAFHFEDNIRTQAKQIIQDLKNKHIKTMMISGDNNSACEIAAKLVNIDEYHANLSATNKLTLIKQQQKNHIVAVVGDGINDSPVFGAAHVSIAMGSGSDIAKNGADVILLNNKLNSIKILNAIAIKTKHIILQNYLWAFAYNVIMLPAAACGFITPYMAVIGMSASSLLVITNSLRLLKNSSTNKR